MLQSYGLRRSAVNRLWFDGSENNVSNVQFDKGVSPHIWLLRVKRAERVLARMRRHGSRRVKVLARRHGGLSPLDAVAAVRADLR